MSRYPKNIIIVIGTLMLLASCSLFNDDKPERTYPKAYGFELTTLQDFLEAQPTDSLDVEVYVTDIVHNRDCPDDPSILCYENAIFVSDTKNSKDEDVTDGIRVNNPRQFQQGQRYRMSFSIEYAGDSDFRIIVRRFMGYSKID